MSTIRRRKNSNNEENGNIDSQHDNLNSTTFLTINDSEDDADVKIHKSNNKLKVFLIFGMEFKFETLGIAALILLRFY